MRRLLVLASLVIVVVTGACGEDTGEVNVALDTTVSPSGTSEDADAQSQCAGQVIVFLQPQRSDAEAEAVGREIEGMEGIDTVKVLGHEDTYEEFQRLFADQPQIVETVTPEILPPSARVQAKDEPSASAVGSKYGGDPRVQEVVLGAELTEDADVPDGFCSPPIG